MTNTTPTPKRDRALASLFSVLTWSLLLALLLIMISYNEFMAHRLPRLAP